MNTSKLLDIPMSDEIIVKYMKSYETATEEKVEKMNGLAYLIKEACFLDEDLEKSALFISVWNQILSDMTEE